MTPLSLDRLDAVLGLNNVHAAELSLLNALHVATPTRPAFGSDDALPPARPEPQVGTDISAELERMHATRGAAGSSVTTKQPMTAMASILPNAAAAVIDPRKITGYSLNTAHPVGSNKARVFASALGLTQANASDLMKQIKAGILTKPATLGRIDEYGSRFTVDVPVVGPEGSGTVRTGWMIDPGSNIPRLTTAFVKQNGD